MKEKLFKFLFPRKAEKIEELIIWNDELIDLIDELEEDNNDILTPFDFANLDEDGNPPHYLKGLSDTQRKNFIAELEVTYANEKFQTVFNYVINVIANYSFQKEPDETKMRNGRYAVIGARTLMKELENCHSEIIESRKKVDAWDPLSIMPE